MRDFRNGRYATVLVGESPVRTVPAAPSVVFHVLPFGTAFDRSDIDVRTIGEAWIKLTTPGKFVSTSGTYSPIDRPNLDGLLISSGAYREKLNVSLGYVQIFRNGGVEFVENLAFIRDSTSFDNHPYLGGFYIERTILQWFENARAFHAQLGISGPLIVAAALLRVQGIPFAPRPGGMRAFEQGKPMDRANIVLPDLLLPDLIAKEVPAALRPLLDALFQAGGYRGSFSFDDTGRYYESR